ncbi:MAG TPA: protein kinase [Kofleriaceae bacterium]|jgi:serine/threonine-protein kinase|nr:protein kinase [Kofleriaceae bacterium]
MPGRPPDDRDPDDRDPAVAEMSTLGPSDSAAEAAGGRSGRGKGLRQVRTGDTLGRYELGDELGEGGMATVFRARDRELRRDVAVKVLFPHLARRTEVVRRFHREARAAAGLEHPNILRIYDVGEAEGDDPPYIVMELVRGRTLLQEIEQRGAVLGEIAACIGALLGDALAAAHAAGVIHRDIKPANVLIAPGGRLLLADFGVARLETEDSLVTRTGALLGTPAYMSPEQASGDIATARSDLYSLGATLYQLATGTLPYSGSPAKVMSMIAAGNLVAPVRRRPSCGSDLSRLIERMMASAPSERPATAAAIAVDLRGFAAASGFGDATEELAAYFEDPGGFLRARTPRVVSALVTAARRAVADARLPRAMALADRAIALAPADPSVLALVQAVTEDGQASRRKRRLALGGIALALVGGATTLGWKLTSSSPPADSPDVLPGDAALARDVPPADLVAAVFDGPAVIPRAPKDAGMAPLPDAHANPIAVISRSPGDAGARAHRVAQGLPSPSDAAPALDAPSPGEPPEPVRDAAPVPASAVGHVIVHNDLWCNVSIDGIERGNRRNQPIEVTAGHHVVRCVNPAGEWAQETDVAPGASQTLTGTMLRDLEITLEVDAEIDSRHYSRGTVVRRKPGNVEVIVGGKKKFITFRTSCTLKDSPELGCYL